MTVCLISKVSPVQYKSFSCDIPELDIFLKRFARNNEKKKLSNTFVLLNDQNFVVAYYTLSAAEVTFSQLPSSYHQRLPRYPIPMARLCRLAVDKAFQRKKIGEYMLMDAIQRVVRISEDLAMHALVVDAKNANVKSFYQHYGFIPLAQQSLKLFLPLSTLGETVKPRLSEKNIHSLV